MTIGAQNLNVVDLLNHRYILMPKGAIEIIEKTFVK
jgi:ribosomal protein L4